MSKVTQVVEIKALNVAYLVGKLVKLNKRASKLSLPAITWRIVGRRTVPITRNKKIIDYCPLTSLEIVGDSPQLAGYAIAAVIEHTRAGNLLRDATGGSVDLSEYRDSGPVCDHCNLKRNRSKTVVLIKDDQTLVRVGKSCLKDYLGHSTIAQLAYWADFACVVGEAEDMDDSGQCYGSTAVKYWDLLDFLSWCAASARESGYVTRTYARESDLEATCDSAWAAMILFYLEPLKYKKFLGAGYIVERTEADRTTARLALDWTLADFDQIKADPDNALNDFQHNLSVIVALGVVEDKHAGYAGSILGYHTRGVAFIEETKARESAKLARESAQALKADTAKHLGTIGEKLLVEVVIGRTIQLPDYGFGCSHLVTMETIGGDCLTWKASDDPRLESGAKLWIRGTVKEHREFRDVPQTSISRCSIRCPICNVEGALTKTGKPRKNGAPFKNVDTCGHWREIPTIEGGGRNPDGTTKD